MADINDWMRGNGTDALQGTDNASLIDNHATDYLQDPLDRLLKNYKHGAMVRYGSAATVIIGVGELVLSNSAGDTRRMRVNTAEVTLTIPADLDTGVEQASQQYYVYAVADADATTFTGTISESSSFPTGKTYAKKIGHFYNNASSDIDPSSVGSDTIGITVQTVNYERTDVVSGSTQIPIDDTIPQISEGNEYLTCTISPTSSTNKLMIEVQLTIDFVGNSQGTIALFKNSDTNAIAAVSCHTPDQLWASTETLRHFMTSGTTDPIVFSVRAGSREAGTTYVNGDCNSGGRIFGGVCVSSITVTELA